MGAGTFSTRNYEKAAATRAASGQADFAYTDSQRFVPRHERKAAASLDVSGVQIRESRDSDEHPESTPIVTLFDVTGSMHRVPVILQKQLGNLFDILDRGSYVKDPQIMVGAIGDDVYDTVPLQIGQFESDNRVDDQLREIYLEGGGGGDKREGYALAAHFVNTKVVTDAWEKRQKKGYLFIIGDELNKDSLYSRSVAKWFGEPDTGENISVESVYEELKKKWEVFYILPNLTRYYDDQEIASHWQGLLGERFVKLDDAATVAQFIATTIAAHEEALELQG
jgi:hypothetical protein